MRRNLLGPAVLALLATGGGAVWALRSSWSTATVQAAGLPRIDLSVSGADVVPGAMGLAILVMAAAAGVIAAGPRLRRVIGVLVAIAGVVGVALTVGTDADPARARAIDEAAASGTEVAWEQSLAQPLTVVAFVAATMVGLLVAWQGPRWATMGRKYEAPAAREPESTDLWKAMDDGVDPTI